MINISPSDRPTKRLGQSQHKEPCLAGALAVGSLLTGLDHVHGLGQRPGQLGQLLSGPINFRAPGIKVNCAALVVEAHLQTGHQACWDPEGQTVSMPGGCTYGVAAGTTAARHALAQAAAPATSEHEYRQWHDISCGQAGQLKLLQHGNLPCDGMGSSRAGSCGGWLPR